ncbi:tyrosine-type recombinase/integrase [Pedobacter sp.]
MELKKYLISLGKHQNKKVIWITFDYDKELILRLKHSFPIARWSSSQKKWHIPDCKHHRDALGLPETFELPNNQANQISSTNQNAYKRYIEQLQLKGYSNKTVKTYSNEFLQLLLLLKQHSVDELSPERLRSYILYCINTLKLSENYIHIRLNALKFYFEKVLNKERFFVEVPRPKKPSKLPKAFSQSDIEKIFKVTENPKHLLMLRLCYGMGLRVSELTNLKITDIDSSRMMVHIQNSKGKKDRYVPLPASILEELRAYYIKNTPKLYLFEGQFGGRYSDRSIQAVFKNSMKKANISKAVGIHGLRHSYATHLLEYGTDMFFIQKLLGHSQIKTTEIYAKVSNKHLNKIVSPLDRLK